MGPITNLVRRLLATEPAVLVGAVVAVLAVVGVSVAPGKAEQATQALAVLLPLLAAGVTRQLVTPTGKVPRSGADVGGSTVDP